MSDDFSKWHYELSPEAIARKNRIREKRRSALEQALETRYARKNKG